MLVFERKADLTVYLLQQRKAGNTIGLVPTMGALHRGHLSLIETSVREADITVCSIFVNPIQFTNKKDLEKYPRTPEKDQKLLEDAGCHVLFCPSVEEMYPNPPYTQFSFGALEEVMEGYYRPGHFRGVGLIVSKLFNIVQPDLAFFGQKDLQQCRIIEHMAADLLFNLKVVVIPTVREEDGLAMSSRNVRLEPEARKEATALYKALCLGRDMLLKGEEPSVVGREVEAFVRTFPGLQLEYFSIADGGTLQPVKVVSDHKQLALCIAGYAGDVRLIDNLLTEV